MRNSRRSSHAHKFLFPSPRERSEWRGGVRGGGRRLLGASVMRAYRKFGASVVPPPLAPQLRCVTRPSPPRNPGLPGFRINECASRACPTCVGGRVATAPSPEHALSPLGRTQTFR